MFGYRGNSVIEVKGCLVIEVICSVIEYSVIEVNYLDNRTTIMFGYQIYLDYRRLVIDVLQYVSYNVDSYNGKLSHFVI